MRQFFKSIKGVSVLGILVGGLIVFTAVAGFSDAVQPSDPLDVPYEPTNPRVVEAMLKLANAGPDDVHFDLGCGDGRIVLMAVKKFKVKHAVGIDIHKQRLREAKERAEYLKLAGNTTFINGNIFTTDISKASVVTAYLLDHINLKMRPLLLMQLKPGSRIVTHAFHMDDWEPDKTFRHPYARRQKIMKWVVPAQLGGNWTWTTNTKGGQVQSTFKVDQIFQNIAGIIDFPEKGQKVRIRNPRVNGRLFSFVTKTTVNGTDVAIKYQGIARGNTIRGTQIWDGGSYSGTYPWVAKREDVNPLGSWEFNTNKTLGEVQLAGIFNVKKGADNKLNADFTFKDSDRKIQINQIYLWGNSVYFRIVLSHKDYILFRGSLNKDAGGGDVSLRATSTDRKGATNTETRWTTEWTAIRKK